MRPLSEMSVIQIEVTNACSLKCANCTRHVGHHKKPFFMDLDYIEKAIDSLDGFEGHIGMMGGDPTLHPKFREVCEIYQKKIPDRRKREFWTSGFKWKEYQDIILETFDKDRIAYNEHSTPGGKHTPLLVAIDDVIDDKELMWKMIDNCWIQKQWSASITPKGGFFCEVAASLDYLFNGPGGYEIKKGWWKIGPADFQDQVKRYCKGCSGALPLKQDSDGFGGRKGPAPDTISDGNLKRLLEVGSPKAKMGHYKLFNEKIDDQKIRENLKDWNPSHFKPFVSHHPEDYGDKERTVDPSLSGKTK